MNNICTMNLLKKNIFIVTGSLHAGMGQTHVNKFLAGLNIPQCNWPTYKRHEEEVGAVTEQMARKSCLNAVSERNLTIENIDAVKTML